MLNFNRKIGTDWYFRLSDSFSVYLNWGKVAQFSSNIDYLLFDWIPRCHMFIHTMLITLNRWSVSHWIQSKTNGFETIRKKSITTDNHQSITSWSDIWWSCWVQIRGKKFDTQPTTCQTIVVGVQHSNRSGYKPGPGTEPIFKRQTNGYSLSLALLSLVS